jgi:hypothetical protein
VRSSSLAKTEHTQGRGAPADSRRRCTRRRRRTGRRASGWPAAPAGARGVAGDDRQRAGHVHRRLADDSCRDGSAVGAAELREEYGRGGAVRERRWRGQLDPARLVEARPRAAAWQAAAWRRRHGRRLQARRAHAGRRGKWGGGGGVLSSAHKQQRRRELGRWPRRALGSAEARRGRESAWERGSAGRLGSFYRQAWRGMGAGRVAPAAYPSGAVANSTTVTTSWATAVVAKCPFRSNVKGIWSRVGPTPVQDISFSHPSHSNLVMGSRSLAQQISGWLELKLAVSACWQSSRFWDFERSENIQTPPNFAELISNMYSPTFVLASRIDAKQNAENAERQSDERPRKPSPRPLGFSEKQHYDPTPKRWLI